MRTSGMELRCIKRLREATSSLRSPGLFWSSVVRSGLNSAMRIVQWSHQPASLAYSWKMSKNKSCHVHVDQESSLTVTICHVPNSSGPRLHAIKARSCASSVFSTALAGTGSTWAPREWGLTAALVNWPRLTCFLQGSPLQEVASKQWQALPSGAHLLVFATLQEPNKETRKRTSKMHQK